MVLPDERRARIAAHAGELDIEAVVHAPHGCRGPGLEEPSGRVRAGHDEPGRGEFPVEQAGRIQALAVRSFAWAVNDIGSAVMIDASQATVVALWQKCAWMCRTSPAS